MEGMSSPGPLGGYREVFIPEHDLPPILRDHSFPARCKESENVAGEKQDTRCHEERIQVENPNARLLWLPPRKVRWNCSLCWEKGL